MKPGVDNEMPDREKYYENLGLANSKDYRGILNVAKSLLQPISYMEISSQVKGTSKKEPIARKKSYPARIQKCGIAGCLKLRRMGF